MSTSLPVTIEGCHSFSDDSQACFKIGSGPAVVMVHDTSSKSILLKPTMNKQPIALVTGANRGLGFEVCRQLAAKGYTVVLSGRDLAKAEAAATEINKNGGTVHAVALEMNLIGAWRVTQAMLPLLRRSSHARIVNVSSGAGAFESPIGFGLQKMGGVAPAYSVSKTALTALTLKLATELKDSGILVNAVCPGWTATYPGGEAQGARPVADGAASIVWAATLPDDGPSGGFFRDGQQIPW